MEWSTYLRFLAALVFVLAVIGLLAWGVRRFGPAGMRAAINPKNRRLGIVEVLPFDAKQRLVLLRRDDVEHLVLIGTAGATVIEAGIRQARDALAGAGESRPKSGMGGS